MQPQFSASEIERMRTILAQHDSARATESNSFDLNNPPRKHYSHQDWPRLVYNHESRTYKTVGNSEELQDAMNDGWSMEPFQMEYEAPGLSAVESAEVDRLDRLIEEAKKKRKAA